jgi:N-acetylglucosamine malate deacetylase 2
LNLKTVFMKILYIFPHPDDESFGPAPAISAQLREGHEVYLLTLTKGEATKQRFRLGVNKKEMGEIRYKEMKCVKKVLGLSGMTVLDLPDNRLKDLDPRVIEKEIKKQFERIRPDVVVTYAVHGISGFHDHLVTHAVVKRVFCEVKDSENNNLKRLAFFTRKGDVNLDGKFRLEVSSDEEIDCLTECNSEDMRNFDEALNCYETYKEVIDKSGVRNVVDERVPFEFFQESFKPYVKDITYGL